MWNKGEIYAALAAEPGPLLAKELAQFAKTPLGPWRAGQLEQLRQRAAAYCAAPIPPLPYQLFSLYWKTGDREKFQAPYYERRGRLLTFSLLLWLEPENHVWKTQLEETVWAICAEPFWCLPAHFMGPGETPLPFAEYATQLDLFACETAFALAETLALTRDRLDEMVARQAELQIERRVFAPFLDGGRFFRFEGMPNNWSAVCGGAIGGAALHLMRDRTRLTSILHRCLSCLSLYLDSFGEDGVSVEGVGYWTYGFGFFVCFADLLARRTGGKLDLLALPKAAAIARCQQYYYLVGGRTVSFADGSGESGFRMGLGCYLQSRFADAALPDADYADPVLQDTCYRYCLALRDFLWYREDTRFGLPAARSVFLPDAQWLLSCSPRIALAAKAGHNGESHNHNDCGSFILYKDGQPLLCDLGAGRYDAAYFGPHRYEIFINASRSHNVALPGGCEQGFGAQYACREVEAKLGEARDVLEMELAGCYPCEGLVSYRRTLTHNKAAGEVTVEDVLEFEKPAPVTESFLSETPITLGAGEAVFSCGGVRLTLRFDPAQYRPELCEEEYLPHQPGPARTAYLLRLSAAAAARHSCRFVLA